MAAGSQPLAFAELLLGGLLLTSAITGESMGELITNGLTEKGKERLHAKASGKPATKPTAGTEPRTGPNLPASSKFDGILQKGEKLLEYSRHDQGRDIRLEPGAPLLANGNFEVVRVASDPSGFGPDYPILRFFTGPWAGKDVYYGHTDTAVKKGQRGTAGQIVAFTSRTGHNAPPGWAEIGFAPGGTPGPFGQPAPF